MARFSSRDYDELNMDDRPVKIQRSFNFVAAKRRIEISSNGMRRDNIYRVAST